MKMLSCTILGLVCVATGRWIGGLEWTSAVFLFFPAFGLVDAILDNAGERIARNAALLLVLPLGLGAVPALSARCAEAIPACAKDPAGHLFVSFLASAALWGAFAGICGVVAAVVGPWSLPGKAHEITCKALVSLAYSAALLGFVMLVCLVDAKLFAMGAAVKCIMALSAVTVFILALKRLLSGKLSMAMESGGASRGATASAVRLAERPNTTFADVAGMAEVKDQIRLRLVEPVKNAARAKKYGIKVGGGMLLYGPPGTGKTLLARAVAGELNLPFYCITVADVFGKYVGESERNIRRIFADIRRNPLSVVFIDELETLFPNRNTDVHESTRKVVSVLLQELDGIDANKNPILLIGATNVPWMVDEAFMRPGRFDVKTFVGLPDFDARRGMLIKAFAKGSVPHEPGLTAYMAAATPNYSGADLNGVMNRLRQMAYDRHMTKYTRHLADEALAMSSPTASGETLDRIHDWEAEFLPANSSNSGSAGVRLAVMPSTTLDDVAGMEDVKEQIRLRLVEPVQHHTLADMYGLKVGGGVLLYGPPGTGKTFLARAVAGELKLPFYCITAADIFGRYVGESEKNVRRLFRDVRKNPLSVVFIDELEAVFPKRDAVSDESTMKVVSVLLQELDGIDANKNPILLIGATNVPWKVDEAFLRPGRFDVKMFVGLPDFDARRQMFINHMYSCKIPHEDGLTGFLAERTEGYTGADINGVWDRMKQLAYMRKAQSFDYALAEEVLRASVPTSSNDIVTKIRAWETRQKA